MTKRKKYGYASWMLLIMMFIIMMLTGCSGGSAPNQEPAQTDAQESSETGTPASHTVSGQVFEDANGNGQHDAGEAGLGNVTVRIDGMPTVTSGEGTYSLGIQEGHVALEVDEATIPEYFTLTTGNDTQSLNVDRDTQAAPIGYMRTGTEGDAYAFGSFVNNPSRFDNYYYELVMENAGQMENRMKIWVIGNSMKAEAQGTITYYNHMNGTMGVYTAQSNQVIVTPIMEMMYMPNPFTFVDELDPATFDEVMYRGEESFDGKSVMVFENTAPGFEARYYVWKDYNLIIKMEAKSAGYQTSFYFKDLAFDVVEEGDITYPPGAEVMDLSGQ